MATDIGNLEATPNPSYPLVPSTENVKPSPPSIACVQCMKELRDPHLLCCLHCVSKECID